jgi:signal transduction histidine kinase/ligand-binding sensor domain-containing protein
MSQYVRERWTAESGFPQGPVYAIAQGSDGYLWIGTDRGLVRFDGFNFRVMDSPSFTELSHVLGLLTDYEGSLWVRLRRPTLLRYRGGIFGDPMPAAGRPQVTSTAMTRSIDGSPIVWILDGEPRAVALRGGKFETLAAPSDFSRSPVLTLAQTTNGDLWIGTRDAGLFHSRAGQTNQITKGLPDLKVNALVAGKDNQLWVGTDAGVARWDGTKLTREGVPTSLDGIQVLALTLDRDANLWVGTNSRGLIRVNAQGAAFLDDAPEHTNDAVTAVFEDREGNIWAASAGVLERLRDSAFTTYSPAEAVPSDGSTPIFADAHDRLWFGPVNGGLWWMKEGSHGRVSAAGLDRDVVYSIAGIGDELWIGTQSGRLTRLHVEGSAISAKTYTQADGLVQDSVYSVYPARDGSVWAGTLSGGVSRLHSERFENYTASNGLLSNTISAIIETADGAMWFATPAGLNARVNGQWQAFGTQHGLPSAEVNCLFEDSAGVLWTGTATGIAFRSGGSFHVPAGAPPSLREPIFGIAEDEFGSLWVAGANHVLRVNRDKLFEGKVAGGDVREYGLADGLRGSEGVRRNRSVVADASGRIWFSMNRGISVVDPARLSGNAAPAIVHVQSISADGAPVSLQGSVHVPGGRKRVTIGYAGLSLSVPDRVRFRYRLDGLEHTWSDPESAREVSYTNLAPGPYRFRLKAGNPDGVWSNAETAVAFEVDPLLWQTWWFRTAIAVACAGAMLAAYRLRLHRLTRGMNLRFEERLAERTRIARELHDTLLQGFLSASMQVHIAADSLPVESQAKPTLTRALQLMGQVIEEGRNAVRGLRSSYSASLDLEHSFSRIQEELVPLNPDAGPVDFQVAVVGTERPLNPVLRDEIYRIGREAVINAFRHSRAAKVAVEMRYSPRQLRVSVRDNGCGIDPETLVSGRDGHWGLSGMRERADRIGARLKVWSSANGTEVELRVPSHVAFLDHRSRTVSWFRGPFRRRTRKNGIGPDGRHTT